MYLKREHLKTSRIPLRYATCMRHLPLVHLTGIEPAHLSILDPKSSASASSATGAY